MPRILIAGCGYVGEAAADLFQQAGWSVEGWTASAESAIAFSAKPYPVCACDASDRAAVSAFGDTFDAVLQCTSSGGGDADVYRRVYLRAAENLVRAFPSATLLFTSSTSVYAQRGAEWVDETSAAAPERETGKILRATEELVLEHGGIVARLAGIYGPGRSGILRRFIAGEGLPPSGEERFLNYAHRDDIASALFLLINERAQLDGIKIFNVVDDAPMPARMCYEWLAAYLKQPLPTEAAATPARKRGDSNKRVSNAKLRGLGWRPRYPSFQLGMAESVIPMLGF